MRRKQAEAVAEGIRSKAAVEGAQIKKIVWCDVTSYPYGLALEDRVPEKFYCVTDHFTITISRGPKRSKTSSLYKEEPWLLTCSQVGLQATPLKMIKLKDQHGNNPPPLLYDQIERAKFMAINFIAARTARMQAKAVELRNAYIEEIRVAR